MDSDVHTTSMTSSTCNTHRAIKRPSQKQLITNPICTLMTMWVYHPTGPANSEWPLWKGFFRVRGHLCYTMTTNSPETPEICWGTCTITPHSLVPVRTPQLSPECLMHLGLPGSGQFEGIWEDRLLIRTLNMRRRLWGEVSGVVGFLSFLMEMQSVQPEQWWKCHRAYHSTTALPTETAGRDWQISRAKDGHRYVTCIIFIMMCARVQCVRKRW